MTDVTCASKYETPTGVVACAIPVDHVAHASDWPYKRRTYIWDDTQAVRPSDEE